MSVRPTRVRCALALLAGFALPWAGAHAQTVSAAEQPATLTASEGTAREKRVGLVIGNADHAAGRLETALNDAGLVSSILKEAGFDVIEGGNTDGAGLRRAVRDFVGRVEAAGADAVAVAYVATHAAQADGENHLLPVDARVEREADLAVEGVRVTDLLRALAALPARVRIVALDAGYPPALPGLTNVPAGFAAIDPVPGVLVATAQTPGLATPVPQAGVVYGVFATALAEMIREPGLDANDLFGRVRLRVHQASNGAQTPFSVGAVSAGFVFFARPDDEPAAAGAPDATGAALRARPLRDLSVADAYARAVEADSVAAYEEFLRLHGADPLARRVRVKLARLREALTWRRTVAANTRDAYWTYLRRYPKGANVAHCRARLARLAAPVEPPTEFRAVVWDDLPPPPPEEAIYADVDVELEPVWAELPAPPPPVHFLPAPAPIWDLPPPVPYAAVYDAPLPAPAPIPFWARVRPVAAPLIPLAPLVVVPRPVRPVGPPAAAPGSPGPRPDVRPPGVVSGGFPPGFRPPVPTTPRPVVGTPISLPGPGATRPSPVAPRPAVTLPPPAPAAGLPRPGALPGSGPRPGLSPTGAPAPVRPAVDAGPPVVRPSIPTRPPVATAPLVSPPPGVGGRPGPLPRPVARPVARPSLPPPARPTPAVSGGPGAPRPSVTRPTQPAPAIGRPGPTGPLPRPGVPQFDRPGARPVVTARPARGPDFGGRPGRFDRPPAFGSRDGTPPPRFDGAPRPVARPPGGSGPAFGVRAPAVRPAFAAPAAQLRSPQPPRPPAARRACGGPGLPRC